ncbi:MULTISPECIES: ATP-binding protein [Streptomyces]|uniref:ATP-binding protein n=1 Tax=Streptomyces dengpaensis TaxID=2049881 RepID=A0ABM6SN27_9ACTN|nr:MULTISPECIES: ATP-binding protein [Streptomyces]AVH55566.1 ATP-binding protein [Streptomyces dengpaensis]
MADLLEVSAAPATGVRATTRSTPGHLAIDLDVTELAVPIVRTIVRAHLKLWGLADLTDGTTFVVTELLTNVLRHVQPTLRTGMRNTQLTLTRLPGALNVCVRDFDPALPKPTRANDEAEHGRGLPLVMAFADDFGCSPFKGGKDVWATFLIGNNGTNGNPQARETS